jgi:hypothetical protein
MALCRRLDNTITQGRSKLQFIVRDGPGCQLRGDPCQAGEHPGGAFQQNQAKLAGNRNLHDSVTNGIIEIAFR